MPDDRDLLPVDVDLRRTLEPVAGQPSGEPAPYLFRRAGRLTLLLGTHVIMLTRCVTPRNDFSPRTTLSGGFAASPVIRWVCGPARPYGWCGPSGRRGRAGPGPGRRARRCHRH